MPNGKDKPPSYLNYRRLSILFAFSLLLTFVIGIRNPFWHDIYQPDDVARRNIKATQDTYIPSLGITIKKGEIVVREGERITEDHVKKLTSARNHAAFGVFPIRRFLSLFLLLFLCLTAVYEFADRNIRKFVLSEKDLIFATSLTALTIITLKVALSLFEHFIPNTLSVSIFIVPVFFFGMIMRIVLFSEAALIFSAVFAVTAGFLFESNTILVLYVFLGNILASYFSERCENRNTILKAGLFTGLIMAFLVLLSDIFLGHSLSDLPLKIGLIVLSGIGSSFIALGLLPVIEHLFDCTTDIKLLELANLEHPLLEEMMVNAPGTYHHSIVVGNLAKAAAEKIGANPLLSRVAAYYHDIGKLKMPHYFVENRQGFEDAHKTLTPSMSALIIHGHVKEGIELAERYRLGTKIKNIIQQHHGTSVVSYFYNRAKGLEDPSLHVVEENDFRYAGPKPQTREAGIIMLADAVEAASRTLDDPTPKRIETHVQNIIERIFLDGQLDECELTLKDLFAIQRSFTAIMLGIFHHRVEYPTRIPNGNSDKKLSKTA